MIYGYLYPNKGFTLLKHILCGIKKTAYTADILIAYICRIYFMDTFNLSNVFVVCYSDALYFISAYPPATCIAIPGRPTRKSCTA